MGARPTDMPLDALLAVGVVLVVTLTAFSVSAAIGLVVGRLGLDELDDSRVAEPTTLGRRPELTEPDPPGRGARGTRERRAPASGRPKRPPQRNQAAERRRTSPGQATEADARIV